jgi:hypothetical protein
MKFCELEKTNDERWIVFHCPGCQGGHSIPTAGARGWKWNGSLDKPTVKPSIFVNRGSTNPTQPACHSFVTDGKIQFMRDSTHALAGKTVDIPEWEES